jgi:hypothetical protein
MVSHLTPMLASAGGFIVAAFMLLIYLGIFALLLAGLWKTFVKAGRPGWEGIIPIYDGYILTTSIAGKEWWWFLLCFIPFVGFIPAILICIDVAKSFGKGAGFGVGLALLSPIFFAILGFGDAQYRGAMPTQGFPAVPGR